MPFDPLTISIPIKNNKKKLDFITEGIKTSFQMSYLDVSVSSDDDFVEVGNQRKRMDTDSGRDVLRDELDKSFQSDPEEEESEGEYSEDGEEDS